MSYKSISLVILLISLATIVKAEEDLMATADKFAACSGKYAALANYFIQQKMSKEIIDTFSGSARGAKLASAVLIQTSRSETKVLSEYDAYIDSMAHPHEQQLTIILLDPATTLEKVLAEDMKDCIELNPLQAKIVNSLRKEVYLNK